VKKKSTNLFVLLALTFTYCSASNTDTSINQVMDTSSTTTTTATLLPTSTTTTLPNVEECTGDDNKGINFERIRNVQKFLNNYGFNAGEVDGYLGNQTIAAIKDFQRYAGLYPDGDVGPLTRNAMNNWTGCESEATQIITTTTTVPSSNDSTTTTTTTTSTTTTTVPSNSVSIFTNQDYGYIPTVSLSDNNILSIFKSINNSDSVCGTPYYRTLPSGVKNRYSNGDIQISNIFNGPFLESSASTYIDSISSSDIKILINGNGDENYKFFFISPYSSQIVSINPTTLSVSSGLTQAVFSKQLFTEGYWFYSFAENESGYIVKSSGLREFAINPSTSQNRDSQNNVELLNFTSNNLNIPFGGSISKNDKIEISYITDQVYKTIDNTTALIELSDQIITLKDNEQASENEILIIENELMLVKSKNNNEYTVERGYLNSIIKSHEVGTSVKKIDPYSEKSIISDFAYAVIRNDSGLRFQLPLNGELQVTEFNLTGCPNGRYSLEEITTFAWREQGLSIVSTSTNRNISSALYSNEFVITDSSASYQHPTLSGFKQGTDGFINDGPRELTVSTGNSIDFDFSGLNPGTSNIKFVSLNFQMIPTDSLKLTKTKSVLIEANGDSYIFSLNFDNLINSASLSPSVWEKGYKYIFTSIDVYDEMSKTTFKNNGAVEYDTNIPNGQHDAYYLDQFSFLTPNQ
tara:strand:+ start:1189 stop:3264 length:2076 start_codon:yes stop_codon:yes gene_type:complete